MITPVPASWSSFEPFYFHGRRIDRRAMRRRLASCVKDPWPPFLVAFAVGARPGRHGPQTESHCSDCRSGSKSPGRSLYSCWVCRPTSAFCSIAAGRSGSLVRNARRRPPAIVPPVRSAAPRSRSRPGKESKSSPELDAGDARPRDSARQLNRSVCLNCGRNK